MTKKRIFSKNNTLEKSLDMTKTWLRHQRSFSESQKDIVCMSRHTHVMSLANDCPERVQDYATLGEKDFQTVVNEYHSLAELEGLANRRKILNAPQLQKWSAVQREIIIRRKLQLEALAK